VHYIGDEFDSLNRRHRVYLDGNKLRRFLAAGLDENDILDPIIDTHPCNRDARETKDWDERMAAIKTYHQEAGIKAAEKGFYGHQHTPNGSEPVYTQVGGRARREQLVVGVDFAGPKPSFTMIQIQVQIEIKIEIISK